MVAINQSFVSFLKLKPEDTSLERDLRISLEVLCRYDLKDGCVKPSAEHSKKA